MIGPWSTLEGPWCSCCAPFRLRIILQDEEEGLDHPDELSYRDLRSAAKEKRRHRKHLKRYNGFKDVARIDCPNHLEQQAHYVPTSYDLHPDAKSVDVRPSGEFPADLDTATTRRFTKREAWKVARQLQTRRIPRKYATPPSRFTNRRQGRKETTEICERAWPGDMEMLHHLHEDLSFYEEWVHIFEGQSWMYEAGADKEAILNGEMEVGETFEVWCRRRINEMRAVKESRLRAKLTARKPSSTMVTSGTPRFNIDDDEDEGYHSSTFTSPSIVTPTTTLPTTQNDIEGHTLLSNFLSLSTRYLAERDQTDYSWFGEYAWYWHRNETGRWVVHDWPCGEDNLSCFCEQWSGIEWEGWDPEGGRRVWLAELLVGAGWEGLWDERLAKEQWDEESVGEQCEMESVHDAEAEAGWDIVSALSTSSSWSELYYPFDLETV